MGKKRIAGIAVVGLMLTLGLALAAEGKHEFVLRDYLNRHWQNELVIYPFAFPEPGVPPESLRLYGPDGKPVLFQILRRPAGSDRTLTEGEVAFKANVEPFGTSIYRLAQGKDEMPKSDLEVEENKRRIRLANALVGIEIPASLGEASAGPIKSLKLRSGTWIGKGRLEGKKIKEYEARLLARGPVFAQALSRYGFTDGTSWEIRFRIIAGEPVILVEERFDFEAPDACWALQLNAGFQPDNILHLSWESGSSKAIPPSTQGNIYSLRPWQGWWGDSGGPAFGLYRSGGRDLLLVGTRRAATWVMPLPRSMSPWVRTNRALDVHVPLRFADGKLELAFPFPPHGRARSWMIAALRTQEALPAQRSSLPHRLLMKYGLLPLNQVKDYVLEWAATEEHPRLYVSADETERIRQARSRDKEKSRVLQLLAGGDEALGKQMAQQAVKDVQGFVDRFTGKSGPMPRGQVTVGMGAHQLINKVDAVLGSAFLTDRQRAVMRAQLAFVGYRLESPDLCSPERGWSANPNMTAAWYSALGKLACLISSHPHAQRWFQRGYEEIRLELDTWVGPGGGWLEAPHYMTVSLDGIVPMAIAARRCGFADFLYDPQLKKTMSYFARISTPPDPDAGGLRLLPAVGNTYHGETSCQTGWMAVIWRERDPDYAREMQWVWTQQGQPMHGCIGGGSPGLQGYRYLYLDPALPMQPPRWGSELFPAVGAVLRSAFPGDRETYMFFRHGPFAEHWDHDEGSFILYGKGSPLVRDWSYNPYTAHPWLHSRVVNNHSYGDASWNEGAAVQAFVRLGHVEYVRGRQETAPGPEDPIKFRSFKGEWPFRQRQPNGRLFWEREILFVKENDPARPSYFVLADTTHGKTWMEWCLWVCAAAPLNVSTNPIKVTGQHDVDMDVFFAAPRRRRLHTLHAEQDGLGPKISQELIHLAQRAGTPVVTVLYPYVRGREQPPRFASIAGGRGVLLRGAFGLDINIVSRQELEVKEAGLSFKGRVGSVQDRPDRLTLSVPEGGSLSFKGQAVQADGAVSVDFAKGRNEIVVRTDGLARRIRLRTPLPPEEWEETSQNAVRVEDGALVISLPQGWKELRLRAP